MRAGIGGACGGKALRRPPGASRAVPRQGCSGTEAWKRVTVAGHRRLRTRTATYATSTTTSGVAKSLTRLSRLCQSR
ncbi:hypothetical protein GCM10018785_58490 [Streptomyces longispororuber]|uniref:Uncharacterized protein n=1 Tax=Streptomyces longispororuber TaxID=68230 RepID=A0A919A119_9ACTN|nr:hypothetical protein GCM10018785_58490 [Streptomyces longispororuber]